MTREEAALKLSTHLMQCGMLMPIKWVEKNGKGSELMEAFELGIAALREQANATQRVTNTDNALNGWISVEERLPEPGQMVLVYCNSRMHTMHVTVSTYMQTYSKVRRCYWSRRIKNVTHWMPLPAPPTEVEEV